MAIRKDIRMRISSDMRGKITTGTKSEKGFPMSLDYFDVSDFPELVAVYGEKPKRIAITFPSNDYQDFFSTEYNTWGGKTSKPIKKRFCDGETCTFNIEEKIGATKYSAGSAVACVCKQENFPADAERCKCYMSLKAYVINPNSGKIESISPYRFENHSVNSADKLATEILKINTITAGKLMGVPFVLSVDMVDQVVAGEKRRYPIWSIQAVGSIDRILDFSDRGLLPVNDHSALALGAGALDESRMIAAGTSQEKPQQKAAPEKPTQTEISLNLDSPSPERQKLLSRFADLQSSFDGDSKAFRNRVVMALKRNWDGDFEKLSEDDLQACLSKIKT